MDKFILGVIHNSFGTCYYFSAKENKVLEQISRLNSKEMSSFWSNFISHHWSKKRDGNEN